MTDSCIIYDAEIKRCIPPKGGQLDLTLSYCEGWHDFAGMGIACLCVWDCQENVPLVFCDDNLMEFQKLVDSRQVCVGFNSLRFDDQLLLANGITVPHYKSYDLLRELWVSDGLDPNNFDFKTHGGYSLENCCQVNFGIGKSGDGAQAPVDWQRGRVARVITYCMRDTMLTRRLFFRAVNNGGAIYHPKTEEIVRISVPSLL